MLRFALSLVAAAAIVFSGYAAFGTAAAAPAPGLKVIATVVAHAHRGQTISVSGEPAPTNPG